MAYGILLLRVVLGLTMAGHGAQKLFGWWGGPGLRGVGQGRIDHGKQFSVVKRGGERRLPGGRYDDNGALLGHLAVVTNANTERGTLNGRP